MPILKIDDGTLSTKVGHYLYFDREGNERAAAFVTNTDGSDLRGVEAAFAQIRTDYGKQDGVQFYQAYLCFKRSDLGDLANPDGTCDPEKLAHYAEEWADRAGVTKRHQYYAVVHDEPGHHPHIHLVWNSVSHIDGQKYHYYGKNDLEPLRDINDKLAREHGIQYIPSRRRTSGALSDAVLRAAGRGAPAYSWKADLARRIRESAADSMNKEEFVKLLSKRGVDARITDKGYSYGFTDARGQGQACKATKLGEECRKDHLLKQFEEHRNTLKENGAEALGRMMGQERINAPEWKQDFRKYVDISVRNAVSEHDLVERIGRQGIALAHPPGAEPTLRYKSESGTAYEVSLKSLGPAYEWDKITPQFEENSKRRTLGAAVYGALRKADDEESFRARLSKQGITVDERGGRFYYSSQNEAHPKKALSGEALGPNLRTEAVKNRLMENGIRSETYGYLKTAMKGARDLEGYERTLKDHGIEYVPAHDDKAAMIRYKDREFQAVSFGAASPEKVETKLEEKAVVRELRSALREAVDEPHYRSLMERRGVHYEPAVPAQDGREAQPAMVSFRGKEYPAADLKEWNPEQAQAQLDRRDAYGALVAALKQSNTEADYHRAYEDRGVRWDRDAHVVAFRETRIAVADMGSLADPSRYDENRSWVRASRHLSEALDQAGSSEDYLRRIAERGVTVSQGEVKFESYTFSAKSFGPNNPENADRALTQRTLREQLGEAQDASRSRPEFEAELTKRQITFTPAEADRPAVVTYNRHEFSAEHLGRLNPEQFERNLAYRGAREALSSAVVEAKDLPHYERLLLARGITYTAPADNRPGAVTFGGEAFQASAFYRLDPARAPENLAQRRVYEHLSSALSQAVNHDHYLDILRSKGIEVRGGGEGIPPTVHYANHTFQASAFGHKSPEYYADNMTRADLHERLRDALAKSPTPQHYQEALAARGIEFRPPEGSAAASITFQGRSYAVEGFERVRPDRFAENRAHLDLRHHLSEALKEAPDQASYLANLPKRGIERLPAQDGSPEQLRFAGHTFEAAKLGRLDPARAPEAFTHKEAHALMADALKAGPPSQEAYVARLQQLGITYRPSSTTDAALVEYKGTSYAASSFGWANPERFEDHVAKQSLFNTLVQIRRDSSDTNDYLSRIEAAGIRYEAGPKPYFEYQGHIIEARQLGSVDPERAQFYQHSSLGQWSSAFSSQTRTMTQILAAEIMRQSHEGYGADPEPHRRRRRRRRADGLAQGADDGSGGMEE